MARKADLKQAMLSKAGPVPVPVPVPEPDAAAGNRQNPHYRPGRQGKVNVTGYFPTEVKKQLRIMAAENNTTIQELMAEAFNDLFAKYGKVEMAPRSR